MPTSRPVTLTRNSGITPRNITSQTGSRIWRQRSPGRQRLRLIRSRPGRGSQRPSRRGGRDECHLASKNRSAAGSNPAGGASAQRRIVPQSVHDRPPDPPHRGRQPSAAAAETVDHAPPTAPPLRHRASMRCTGTEVDRQSSWPLFATVRSRSRGKYQGACALFIALSGTLVCISETL